MTRLACPSLYLFQCKIVFSPCTFPIDKSKQEMMITRMPTQGNMIPRRPYNGHEKFKTRSMDLLYGTGRRSAYLPLSIILHLAPMKTTRLGPSATLGRAVSPPHERMTATLPYERERKRRVTDEDAPSARSTSFILRWQKIFGELAAPERGDGCGVHQRNCRSETGSKKEIGGRQGKVRLEDAPTTTRVMTGTPAKTPSQMAP